MNEDEKIKLRIAAAKILGWEEPITQSQDGTWYGHYGGARLKSPLPDCLDNADDCEALLMATMWRRWKVIYASFNCCCLKHDFGMEVQEYGDGMSNATAYRIAVTRACVAAWQAEEGGEKP